MTFELLPLTGKIDAEAARLALDYGGRLDDATTELAEIIAILTRVRRPAPWITYVAERRGIPVGLCSFKTAPIRGEVEIAYGTFAVVGGQGVAKAMAGALVALAAAQPENPVVIAHTDREPNASTRVLRYNGFVFDGEFDDPEDGLVWRWVRVPRPA